MKMLPDTKLFNITFVQTVQNYPVLYDITRADYNNRDENDRAWGAIGEKFNSTRKECKLRWKNLRCGLTRYMGKRTRQEAKEVFYLWEIMQFVVPFLRSRPQSGTHTPNLGLKIQSYDSDDAYDLPLDISTNTSEQDDGGDSSSPDNSILGHNDNGDFGEPTPSSNTRKPSQPDNLEKAVTNYIASKIDTKQSNPDMDFFKSILPDIACFSLSKKRKFKSKVLELIDELSTNDAPHRTVHGTRLIGKMRRIRRYE